MLLLNFFASAVKQHSIFRCFVLGSLIHPIEIEVLHVVLVELIVLGQLLVERNLGVFYLQQERDSESEQLELVFDWLQLLFSGFLGLSFALPDDLLFGVF